MKNNITKASTENLTNEQIYLLTMNNRAQKMSDADGQVLTIAAWALYQDEDYMTNDVKEILSILTEEGEVFATVSSTFKRDFLKMADVFGEELKKIQVITGRSKNGRTYVTCAYAK